MSYSIRIQKDINGGFAGIYRNKWGKLVIVNGDSIMEVINRFLLCSRLNKN